MYMCFWSGECMQNMLPAVEFQKSWTTGLVYFFIFQKYSRCILFSIVDFQWQHLYPDDVILMLALLNISFALSLKVGFTINKVIVGIEKYPSMSISKCFVHQLQFFTMLPVQVKTLENATNSGSFSGWDKNNKFRSGVKPTTKTTIAAGMPCVMTPLV